MCIHSIKSHLQEYLERMSSLSAERNTLGDLTAEDLVKDQVFKQTFIPQRLDEVVFYERDIRQVKSGQLDELIYSSVTGIKADLSGTLQVPEILAADSDNDGSSSSSSSSGDEQDSASEDENGKKKFVSSARPRDESPNTRRERKKAIKAEKSEKRKTKIKKHVKKRKEKVAKPNAKK